MWTCNLSLAWCGVNPACLSFFSTSLMSMKFSVLIALSNLGGLSGNFLSLDIKIIFLPNWIGFFWVSFFWLDRATNLNCKRGYEIVTLGCKFKKVPRSLNVFGNYNSFRCTLTLRFLCSRFSIIDIFATSIVLWELLSSRENSWPLMRGKTISALFVFCLYLL